MVDLGTIEMSLLCESYETELISPDKIGFCEGTCEDDADCINTCTCYKVDRDWRPNFQDYTTFVIYIFCLFM